MGGEAKPTGRTSCSQGAVRTEGSLARVRRQRRQARSVQSDPGVVPEGISRSFLAGMGGAGKTVQADDQTHNREIRAAVSGPTVRAPAAGCLPRKA